LATDDKQKRNPFRIHGVATGEAFADRVDELARLGKALTDGGSKLIMYGPRRMGKTSALLRAVDTVNKNGGHAIFADLSTASSAADMSNRLLTAAGAILGKSIRDFITDLVSKLKLSITLTADPVTGLVLPGLDVQSRDWNIEKQRQTLTDVLDALDLMARKRSIVIGIALDEFQEIASFGGEKAEWHLRGALQQHHHLAYVLAGSRAHLISRMTGASGAFYKFADKMSFGPINPALLAAWIDKRFRSTGIAAKGVGAVITGIAGSRTRDCIQLARVCHDRARFSGSATATDVEAALKEIVAEENDLYLTMWRNLTTLQQNVLRAIAAADRGLTTRDVLRRFALGSSGAAVNAATAMVEAGLLLREDAHSGERVATPTGYAFDSPFFLAWVWWNALEDMGATMTGMVREGPFRFAANKPD
jgi:hypothetical protein